MDPASVRQFTNYSVPSQQPLMPVSYLVETAEDLPQDLRQELDRLEELFTVDTAMLKKITNRFGEELEDGEFLVGALYAQRRGCVASNAAFPVARDY